VTANATYDILGKFIAEYVRCKVVEVPDEIIALGTI
jgi:translation initiation factor 2 beta subunit (eIF-2beta)/eIF-5